MTAFLYSLTVLIWGTTWIAIHNQIGPVPVEISIVYRFALAGLTLFALLLATGKLQKLALRDQPFVLLQALCLFSCNFLCLYMATAYVPSGIVSVVFSAATIFNLINGFLFLGRRPTARIVAGALIGVAGIACLFWQVLHEADLSPETAQGLSLSLLGTWSFSLGNIVSARNQARGLPLTTTNAWAMLYGAGIVTLFALARGVPFAFDTTPLYVGSLVYLAIPGSVIGFTAYLTVVHRLGPEKAAYMTVLFPVVALTISVFVENYHPTGAAALGLVLVLLGNVLVLLRRSSGPAKQPGTITPDSTDTPGTGLRPARQA